MPSVDYGNAETNNLDDGKGTMEAVYFGVSKQWGRGAGDGPWVMADIENGLWAGDVNPALGNTPLTTPFVTAMVKGGENGFALKGGDATNGTLKVMWDGPRPPGYRAFLRPPRPSLAPRATCSLSRAPPNALTSPSPPFAPRPPQSR